MLQGLRQLRMHVSKLMPLVKRVYNVYRSAVQLAFEYYATCHA